MLTTVQNRDHILPIEVLALIAVARSKWDPKAPVRGFVDHNLISSGITTHDGTYWVASHRLVKTETGEELCVWLEAERNKFGTGERYTETFVFPLRSLDAIPVTLEEAIPTEVFAEVV